MLCFDKTVRSLLIDTIARLNKLSFFSLLPAGQVFRLLEASSVSLVLFHFNLSEMAKSWNKLHKPIHAIFNVSLYKKATVNYVYLYNSYYQTASWA